MICIDNPELYVEQYCNLTKTYIILQIENNLNILYLLDWLSFTLNTHAFIIEIRSNSDGLYCN